MAEYEEEGRVVRLEWTCASCGAKNPGGTRFCAGCGAPMEAGAAFEMPAEVQEVTDASEVARAKRGADVHCGYCGGRNPAGAEMCSQCGASMAQGTARKAGHAVGRPPVAPPVPVPTKPAGSRKWLVAVAAMVVLGLFMLLRTHDTAVQVSSVAWTTQVDFEQQRTVRREGWRRELPSGARILSSERRLHHSESVVVGHRDEPTTERVQVGTKKELVRTEMRDQGNGYAQEVKVFRDVPVYEERKVMKRVPVTTPSPVYDTWCRYEAEVWEPDTVRLEGQDVSPRWPQAPAGSRERGRKGTYRVSFSAGGKAYTWEPPSEQDFARFAPGSTWKVRVNGMGAVVQVL